MTTAVFSFQERMKFTRLFVIIFYVLAAYKWLNGMWLYQMQPQFFNTRFDLSTWLFMQTGIHQWLLNNPAGWWLFDASFYTAPLLYWLLFRKNLRASALFSVLLLIINWLYVQCYVLYPTNSIEGYPGWLLIPFLLMTVRLRSFYFLMHGLRYFFLFFLFSAALWKVWQGGVFNGEQMSGILLLQHKEFLVAFPNSWYTQWIYWLVRHTSLSYLLYISATVLEALFVIGFFTTRFDRVLLLLFVLFLITDFVVMRIPYFEIIPLALPLLFSKYQDPVYGGSSSVLSPFDKTQNE